MDTRIRKLMKYRSVVDQVAMLSKDRRTQVGAVAFDDRCNILATGRNGFPRGVNDDIDARHERPEKYYWTAHAEENLVAQAAYVGHSLAGATVMVSALYPCSRCARMLIQAGIVRVISPHPDTNPRWAEEARYAQIMFQEAGVEVLHYEHA